MKVTIDSNKVMHVLLSREDMVWLITRGSLTIRDIPKDEKLDLQSIRLRMEINCD